MQHLALLSEYKKAGGKETQSQLEGEKQRCVCYMLEKTIFVCVYTEVGGHLLVPSLWKSAQPSQEDPRAQSLISAPSELLGVSFSKHAPYILYHTGVFTRDEVC